MSEFNADTTYSMGIQNGVIKFTGRGISPLWINPAHVVMVRARSECTSWVRLSVFDVNIMVLGSVDNVLEIIRKAMGNE